jgi:type III secretory pathway component EscV
MAKPTASKQKPKKSIQAVTKGEMEQLLADQASMILNAVHEKLSVQERRFNIRLEKMEERFAKRLDELTKTLDKFLKRVSDIEEEFTFMKADLNRVKDVLRKKLGVVLD